MGLGYNKDSQGHQEMFQLHQRRKVYQIPLRSCIYSHQSKYSRVRRRAAAELDVQSRRIDADQYIFSKSEAIVWDYYS